MESNVQKIREAARHLLCVIEEMGFKPWRADDPLAIACDRLDAALALPLHNADVGTAEEQTKRFHDYCLNNSSVCDVDMECCRCPLEKVEASCELAWSQMPYEEGGAK